MRDIVKALPGLAVWIGVTVLAAWAYRSGFMTWRCCGILCLMSLWAAVAINQNRFKGDDGSDDNQA